MIVRTRHELQGTKGLALLIAIGAGACTDIGPDDFSRSGQAPIPLTTPVVAAELVRDSLFGIRVHAQVRITNPTDTPGFLTLREPCTVVVEYYDSPNLALPIRWREWLALHGCKSFPKQVTVSAHQTVEVTSYPAAVTSILGDSLPPGRFWAVAVVVAAEVPGKEIRVPLVPVDLEH